MVGPSCADSINIVIKYCLERAYLLVHNVQTALYAKMFATVRNWQLASQQAHSNTLYVVRDEM